MFSLREWAGLLFKQAREDLGYSQQFVADELEIDIRTIPLQLLRCRLVVHIRKRKAV